jgi:hypothetical protein
MKKLRLSLETLAVESFSPGGAGRVGGTVKARGDDPTSTLVPLPSPNCITLVGCSNECSNYTQDGSCALSLCTCVQHPCGMASAERTFVCCQGTANCPPG